MNTNVARAMHADLHIEKTYCFARSIMKVRSTSGMIVTRVCKRGILLPRKDGLLADSMGSGILA